MTTDEWLKLAQKQLELVGIGTARLDALVLLEHVLGVDRSRLLAEPEMVIPDSVKNVLNELLERRKGHEPIAYLLGKSEFYGREFIVTPAVLEPRPESETMIELLLKAPRLQPKAILADVGTGSGALGITAQLELPHAHVDLIDIDHKAIEIAKRNVIKFATGQNVISSDLLAQVPRDYEVLLCNLPYVPDEFHINEAAQQEPKIAIFGGPDGLDLYRKLFEQIQKLKTKPLLILTESLPPQHEALAGIASHAGYEQTGKDDFIQTFEPLELTV